MLNDKFKDLLQKFSRVNFDSKPVLFSRETFSDLNEFSECRGLNIASRQRYVANGLIDNLIIQTDKKTAQLVGIWLLSAVFQRKYSSYFIKLNSGESVVNEIKFSLRNSSKIIIEPINFEWQPRNVEEFVSESGTYLGGIPCVYLTNNAGEWLSREEFQTRNVVEIVSSIGGAIPLAEFFLNIGINESIVNYEYLKYEYGGSVLSVDSCEIRVEVFHEIAEQKTILSTSIH